MRSFGFIKTLYRMSSVTAGLCRIGGVGLFAGDVVAAAFGERDRGHDGFGKRQLDLCGRLGLGRKGWSRTRRRSWRRGRPGFWAGRNTPWCRPAPSASCLRTNDFPLVRLQFIEQRRRDYGDDGRGRGRRRQRGRIVRADLR